MSRPAEPATVPEDADAELVAPGLFRHTWRNALVVFLTAAGLGSFFGLLGAATAHNVQWHGPLLVGVIVGTAAGVVAVPFYVSAWGCLSARVRYYVSGSRIIVYRGRRRVADLDTNEFDEVWVDDDLTWRDLAVLG